MDCQPICKGNQIFTTQIKGFDLEAVIKDE